MRGVLASSRVVVVTGKGGVGRSTVSAALGRALADAGRRAVVVELSGQHAAAAALGLRRGTYDAQRVAPGLDHRTLTAPASLADFAQRKLRLPAVSGWLLSSKPMASFLEAVPGLEDLLQLGKVENMLNEPLPGEPTWDVVVLDAPATGHGLTLLAAARAARQTARTGPLFDLASIIERFLADAHTQFVVTALPEPLPVHEGLELVEALTRDHAPPALVVVNRCAPPWPGDALADALDAALADGAPPRDELRGLARAARARSAAEAAADGALHRGLGADGPPTVRLPQLEDPSSLAPLTAALAPACAP